MRHLLYAIIATGQGDADTLLATARMLMRDEMLDAATQMSTDDALVIQRGAVACQLRLDRHSAPGRMLIGASAMTPEAVGLCWDVLIGMHAAAPHPVWISTYSEQELERFAEARLPRLTIDGRDGTLLQPEQFDTFLARWRPS